MPRTRSARAHQDVLDAAIELFAERGIDATSMDAISEVSGVSKATIYKHWADKDALCMEALIRAHGVDDLPPFNSGNLRKDLLAFLEYRAGPRHNETFLRLMPHFMGYAVRNPAFGRAWKARVMEPPRTRLRQLLERGIQNGELKSDLDIGVAIALLLGPMVYRFAAAGIATDLPEDLPRRVAEAFLRAHAIVKAAHAAKRIESAVRKSS